MMSVFEFDSQQPGFIDSGHEAVDLPGRRNVAGQHRSPATGVGRELRGCILLPLALVRQNDVRALTYVGLNNSVRKAPLVRDTEDESRLPGQEIRHEKAILAA